VLFPMGSPALLGRQTRLAPEVIARHRLLHLVTRPEAWRSWCLAAEISNVNVMRGPRFDIQATLISAACSGLGVALLPRFLVANQIRSGQLKVLSNLSMLSEGSYYFAYPEEKTGDALLTTFRAWLQTQAVSFRQRDATLHNSRTTPRREER